MTLSLPCTLKGRRGRYEVVSKLTEGGMSTIYVGKSKRGQAVIVKEASGLDLAQPEERLRGGEKGVPPVYRVRHRHLHTGLGGPGAESGRGNSGERLVQRRRGSLLPPHRPRPPSFDETARGWESGTLPIPP